MTTANRKPAKAGNATLASMAPATAPTTAPAPAPVVEKKVLDWSQEFEPVKVKVYTRNESASIDYEAETPAFIKERVTSAYAKTMEAVAAGNTRPVWVDQPFAEEAYVLEFDRLARRYAAFKGWTYRCPTEKNRPSKKVATFAVKPKETRTKKPVPAPAVAPAA